MKRLALSFLCLFLIGATACRHEQRPDDVLDADAMIDFFTELYVVEGCYAVESQYRFDSPSPEILAACDSIMKKKHLTRERVEKSLDYYALHPEEYESIQKEVAARIDRLIGPDGEHSQE